jgi:hypothetical protein
VHQQTTTQQQKPKLPHRRQQHNSYAHQYSPQIEIGTRSEKLTY